MPGLAESFIGSIDQGTTSTRFLIFNRDGEPVASHQVEFEQIYPNPGYLTHTKLLRPVLDANIRADGTNMTHSNSYRRLRNVLRKRLRHSKTSDTLGS